MFSSIAAFLQVWAKEAEFTQRILDVLTDESLAQPVTVHDRTLGRIAWHLAATIPEMMSKTGLTFPGFDEDAPVPSHAEEIANDYREANGIMVKQIQESWNDQTLFEERNMYGENWKVGDTLQVLINHQIHHRGQLTVLMRQAGLKVPGIYGPSKEDWSAFGMEPPKV